MRLSCSIILITVFLVLQSESAPIIVSPSTIEVPGVQLGSIASSVVAVNGLTETLLKRAVLPLNTNQLSNAVSLGPVAPIAGHATTQLSGLGLPTLAHASIPLDGILVKRNLGGFFSPLADKFGNIASGTGMPRLDSIPGATSIPGASSLQDAAYGTFSGFDSLSGAFQKRDLSELSHASVPLGGPLATRNFFSSPLGKLGNTAHGIGMPRLASIPGGNSLQSVAYGGGGSFLSGLDSLSGALQKRNLSSLQSFNPLGSGIPEFGSGIPGLSSLPSVPLVGGEGLLDNASPLEALGGGLLGGGLL